jgi:Cu(I)/Ag(I) efflux system protein CusF
MEDWILKEFIAYAIPLLLVTALHQACTRPQSKPPSSQSQSATVQNSAGGEQAAQAGPSAQATTGAKVFRGQGVVEGVDRSIDTIQINHGDIKGYMPAMSMPYRVKDKSMLDLVKQGDKVTFTLEDTGKGAVLIEIKKVAA